MSAQYFVDERRLDRRNPAAQELHDALAASYSDRQAVTELLGSIGWNEEDVPWAQTVSSTWWNVLERLARRQQLRAVAERARGDENNTAYHETLAAILVAPIREWDDPTPPSDELIHAVASRVAAEGPSVALSDEEVASLRSHAPRSAQAYHLRRIADWRDPHLLQRREDLRRFTRLSLLVDRGEDAQVRWQEKDGKYEDLQELLEDAGERYPVLVLLGEPGAGKTTLLRRLELETACRGLGWDGGREAESDGNAPPATPESAPIAFTVPLGEYKDAAPPVPPRAWLEQRWAALYPAMPSLPDLLATRPVLLLLDALNEMPHGGEKRAYDARVVAWRDALAELRRVAHPSLRCVFSCRSLDYSTPLSSRDLRVPHIRVERLTDAQIQDFLAHYLPDRAAGLWERIRAGDQIDIFRTPYFLRLLVDQVGADGEVPKGRAALFAGFVRQAMRREIEAGNPLFDAGHLLHDRDRGALLLSRLRGIALPGRGPLIPAMERLAFTMQRESGAGQQVVVALDDALAWGESERSEEVIDGGCALGLLDVSEDPQRGTDQLRFHHQLMQEFFAARALARTPDPEAARVAWRADAVDVSLAEAIEGLAPADPLPRLPQTGWEVTTTLAAAMAEDAASFVRGLIDANLPLAARAAIEPGTDVPESLRAELRQLLIDRTQHPDADLRARIDAAEALGEIGDPRFIRASGPHGDYLVPPMRQIPAGRYTIGTDDGYPDERPAHEVDIQAFALGAFPVTNAEYRCFVEAGGYEDGRWWETEDARKWLRGDADLVEPAKQHRRDFWSSLPKDDDGFQRWLAKRPRITEVDGDWLDWFRSLDPEALEERLDDWYPTEAQRQPEFWRDARYNHPAEPVVGICWYEARAYCAWLSAQTGVDVRLPTEAEWEAAARGTEARAYPYGDRFDSARCNTFESHLRSTTPIGVFPGGRSNFGLEDMSGNVWEWTLSLWGRDSNEPAHGYPYDPNDGREDVSADAACLRVLRGGSWGVDRFFARAAFRDRSFPTERFTLNGFRLASSSPISQGPGT